jgi:hypothetical protein
MDHDTGNIRVRRTDDHESGGAHLDQRHRRTAFGIAVFRGDAGTDEDVVAARFFYDDAIRLVPQEARPIRELIARDGVEDLLLLDHRARQVVRVTDDRDLQFDVVLDPP